MAGHQKPYGTTQQPQQPYATEAYPIERPYAGPTANGVTVVDSTVTAQPTTGGLVGNQHQQRVAAVAHGKAPRTHCFLAWIACLFCCWPIGLGAIFMSYNVSRKMRNNDFEGAHKASQMAKRLALAAIVIGIIAWVSGWTSYSETDYGNTNRSSNLRSSTTYDSSDD